MEYPLCTNYSNKNNSSIAGKKLLFHTNFCDYLEPIAIIEFQKKGSFHRLKICSNQTKLGLEYALWT